TTRHCRACHQLGGTGGSVGPALRQGTERRNRGWLTHFLANPRPQPKADPEPPYPMPQLYLPPDQVAAGARHPAAPRAPPRPPPLGGGAVTSRALALQGAVHPSRRVTAVPPARVHAAVCVGLIAYAFALQFATPHLGSIDGYFHIRYSALLRESGWRAFPPP